MYYKENDSGSVISIYQNGTEWTDEEFEKEVDKIYAIWENDIGHIHFYSKENAGKIINEQSQSIDEMEEARDTNGDNIQNQNWSDLKKENSDEDSEQNQNVDENISMAEEFESVSQNSNEKKEGCDNSEDQDKNSEKQGDTPRSLIDDNNNNTNQNQLSDNETETGEEEPQYSFLPDILKLNPDWYYNKDAEEKKEWNNSTDTEENEAITYDINCDWFIPDENHSQFKSWFIPTPKLVILHLSIPPSFYWQSKERLTIVLEQKNKQNKVRSSKYNGLINEAMTCYMNSMIQSLNVLGKFKKLIFELPFDNTENSFSYSLQRLFYDLSFYREPASTSLLVRSFGWSRRDIFVQHDVQEFNMMLSDLMEKKFKGTPNEALYKAWFEGKMSNEIRCLNYNYNSKKEETFNDIQWNVKNCKNIYDSFNAFTEEEWWDGDDKFWVEGHGKEEAKKSFKFISFPPILMLQLKRFEYNSKKCQMDKINDKYVFYPTIDLNKYAENNISNDWEYEWLSIVVHKGSVYGGHYYAFIRYGLEKDGIGEWFCFNDETVTPADMYEVFDINFGGFTSIYKYNNEENDITKIRKKSNTSAYMLLYIKKNMLKDILQPIRKDDIPNEIWERIIMDKIREREEEAENMKKYEEMERQNRKEEEDRRINSNSNSNRNSNWMNNENDNDNDKNETDN